MFCEVQGCTLNWFCLSFSLRFFTTPSVSLLTLFPACLYFQVETQTQRTIMAGRACTQPLIRGMSVCCIYCLRTRRMSMLGTIRQLHVACALDVKCEPVGAFSLHCQYLFYLLSCPWNLLNHFFCIILVIFQITS